MKAQLYSFEVEVEAARDPPNQEVGLRPAGLGRLSQGQLEAEVSPSHLNTFPPYPARGAPTYRESPW